MKRKSTLILAMLIIFASACAPAYKTKRIENFSGDYRSGITSEVLKANLASKSIVIISFYDGEMEFDSPQFICTVDSVDDVYLYGNLAYANVTYHQSG